MERQTNNDARRGTLLRFGHRASASSGLHERWSSIQSGRVPAPLCGMLLPFQAIPTQRTPRRSAKGTWLVEETVNPGLVMIGSGWPGENTRRECLIFPVQNGFQVAVGVNLR